MKIVGNRPRVAALCLFVAGLAAVLHPVQASSPETLLNGQWRFSENVGTKTREEVTRTDGTLSAGGSRFTIAGKVGNALDLYAATNGFVNGGSLHALTNDSFAVVAWFKTTPWLSADNTIVLARHQWGATNGFALTVNAFNGQGENGRVGFYLPQLGTNLTSQTAVNDGSWHQVVVSCQQRTNFTMYLDNVVQWTNTVTKPIGLSPASFLFGGVQSNGVPIGLFDGQIDEVQFYERSLTSNEIQYLYDNPSAVSVVPPTNLKGTPFHLSATLTWDIAASATNYVLWRSASPGGTALQIPTGKTNYFQNTGLNNDQPYYYSVSAQTAAGNSVRSEEIEVTPRSVPAEPTDLTGTPGNRAVLLKWEADQTAERFFVKSSLSQTNFQTIAVTTNKHFLVEGLPNGVTNYFTVSALNAYGESADCGNVPVVPAPGAPPRVETIAVHQVGDQFLLTWLPSPGATSYRVSVGGSDQGPFGFSGSTATNAYVLAGLNQRGSYYFIVVAANAFGSATNSDPVGREFYPLLQVRGGATTAEVQSMLSGAQMTITNVRITGHADAIGFFTNGMAAGLGLEGGIVIASGHVTNAVGPNTTTGRSTPFGTPGDPELDALSVASGNPLESLDAISIEFDLFTTNSTITLRYVFASEEYKEWVNTPYNDAFAVLINSNNAALLPGTQNAAEINSINHLTNQQYYVDNDQGVPIESRPAPGVEYDGLTVVLTASAQVTPNTTNRIKFVVADRADSALDSAVFIGLRSFNAGPPDAPTNLVAIEAGGAVWLTWSASTGSSAYRLMRSASGGDYSLLATVAGGTTFADYSVAGNTTYRYKVQATNVLGDSPFSAETEITTVASPPAISGGASFTNRTLAIGETFILLSQATGAGALKYAWFKDGTVMLGQNGPSLTILNVQLADEGTYQLVATDSLDRSVTNQASLVLITPPRILGQPIGGRVMSGTEMTFSATVAGGEPLSYHWYHLGTNLVGQDPTLPITAGLATAGTYQLLVTNGSGSAWSFPVELQVTARPVRIITPPMNLHGSGSFSIEAQGQGTLTYQWHFNGTPITNATNASVSGAAVGVYTITVTDSEGGTASAAAHLGTGGNQQTIMWRPSERLLGSWPITNVPPTAPPVTLGTLGSSVYDYQTPPSVWHPDVANNWWAPGPNGVSLLQSGNNNVAITLDRRVIKTSILEYYRNERLGTNSYEGDLTSSAYYIRPAYCPDIRNAISVFSFAETNQLYSGVSQNYIHLAWTNTYQQEDIVGDSVDGAIYIESTIQASMSDHQVVNPGGNIQFVVNASGAAPLSYQWRFNGRIIPLANSAELVITNAQPKHSGHYSVLIIDANGAIERTSARARVITPGSITGWGDGQSGQFNITSVTNAVAIAVGQYAAAAVTADGSVVSTGGIAPADPGITNAFDIAVGGSDAVVIRKDGTFDLFRAGAMSQNAYVASNSDDSQWFLGVANLLGFGSDWWPLVSGVVTRLHASYAKRFSQAAFRYETSSGNTIPTVAGVLLDRGGGLVSIHEQSGGYADSVYGWSGALTYSQAGYSHWSENAFPPSWLTDVVDLSSDGRKFRAITAQGVIAEWDSGGRRSAFYGTNNQWLPVYDEEYAVVDYREVKYQQTRDQMEEARVSAIVPLYGAVSAAEGIASDQFGGLYLFAQEAHDTTIDPEDSRSWAARGVDITGIRTVGQGKLLLREDGSMVAMGGHQIGAIRWISEVQELAAGNTVMVIGTGTGIRITQQPKNQTVAKGTSVSISVAATIPGSTNTLRYQWYQGSWAIPGATNTTLTIANSQPWHAGPYAVAVWDEADSQYAFSETATLTVWVPLAPVVYQQPEDKTVKAGQLVTFNAGASGTAPVTIEWYQFVNGSPVLRGTGPGLMLKKVKTSDAGLYKAKFSNAYGSAWTDYAELIVNTAPGIAQQPQSITVPLGATAHFDVAFSGEGPVTYQWRKGGINIAAATNESLILNPTTLQSFSNALYTVVVRNPHGAVTSSVATLTMGIDAFKNGDFENLSGWVFEPEAPSWVSHSAAFPSFEGTWMMGFNYGTATSGKTLSQTFRTQAGETYRVSFNVGRMNWDTGKASLEVSATNATGPLARTYIAMPPAYQGWGNTQSFAFVASSDTTTLTFCDTSHNPSLFDVMLDNLTVVLDSSAFVVPPPNGNTNDPAILIHPSSVAVPSGDMATLGVHVTGTTPISYQWFKDGSPLTGATYTYLFIPGVPVLMTGDYFVVVSNSQGVAVSQTARLTVQPNNSSNRPPEILVQPQSQAIREFTPATMGVVAVGSPPLHYQWHLRGEAEVNTNLNWAAFTFPSVQIWDQGAYFVVITNAYGAVTSSLAHLSIITTNTAYTNLVPSIVWQPESLTVGQGDYANIGVVAKGAMPFYYTWFKDGQVLSNRTTDFFEFQPVLTNDAGSYQVVVMNMFGCVTSSVASVTVTNTTYPSPPPSGFAIPAIVTHPESLSVHVNNSAALRVTTSGRAPMGFQWQKAVGFSRVHVSAWVGATPQLPAIPTDWSTFTWTNVVGRGGLARIDDVLVSDSGAYRVVITNAYGSVTSSVAILTVTGDLPIILTQPADVAAKEHGTALFGVSVKSQFPVWYQWRKAGAVLTGQTNRLLQLSQLALTDTDAYSVVVSCIFGSVASREASLEVNESLDPDRFDVVLLSPDSGEVLKTPTRMLLAASASDPTNDVDRVEFFVNGQLFTTVTNAPYSYTWFEVPAGSYTVQAKAWNSINQSVTSRVATVQVKWSPNLGHFSTASTDMEIPALGVPLTVNRVYDNRLARPGEFGMNSALDVSLMTVNKSGMPGTGWAGVKSQNTYSIVLEQERLVSVNLPGAKLDFQPTLVTASKQYPPHSLDETKVQMTFVGVGGAQGSLQDRDGSPNLVVYDYGDDGLGEISLWKGDYDSLDNIYDPELFDYIRPDGRIFEIKPEGGVEFVRDRNGNWVQYSTNVVTHNTGRFLRVERDADNRITAIYDPNGIDSVTGLPAGPPALKYSYTNGNLVKMEALVTRSNSLYAVTRYDYLDGRFPGYITHAYDPSNRLTLVVEYDSEGRIIKQTDADNKSISYGYNTNTFVVTMTNRTGQVTEERYSAAGRLTNSIVAGQSMGSAAYDWKGRKIAETDPKGNTTQYEYDEFDRLVSTTNPNGNTQSATYNNYGQPTSESGPGGSVSYQYDGNGNPTSVTDASGYPTSAEYGTNGLKLVEVSQTGGTNLFAYNEFGDLTNSINPLTNWTRYTYDANGNKLSEITYRTDLNGVVRYLTNQFVYDARNRLIATLDPYGYASLTMLDLLGKQVASVDKAGRTTSLIYDKLGRVVQAFYPDGSSDGTAFDAEGRRLFSTNRVGRVTSYYYDDLGRLIATTYPDGSSTQTDYDNAGRVIRTRDARTNWTWFGFDAGGQRTSVTNSLGDITFFGYDGSGNQTHVTNALGQVTVTVYNGSGQVSSIQFPDNTSKQFTYGPMGLKLTETDQANITTGFGYDILGRLVAVTNALGTTDQAVTRYAYDELGNQIAQFDALGRVTQYDYDLLGRRIKRVLPQGQVETAAYDVLGNRTFLTNFNGQAVQFFYDNMNRLVAKGPASATSWAVTYSYYTNTSLRASMTDSHGTTTYTYDLRDRLVQKLAPNGTLTYSYDSNGNLTSLASPNQALTNSYDALNRLTNVTDFHLGATAYGYNAVGNLVSVANPNGVWQRYSYDDLNRLTGLIITNAASVTYTNASGDTITDTSGRLFSVAYTLAANGHRLGAAESFYATNSGQFQTNGLDTNWEYDSLWRLTNATAINSLFDAEGFRAAVTNGYAYNFDLVGNRTFNTNSQATTNGTNFAAQHYSYSSNDWLTAVASPTHNWSYNRGYDLAGNTLGESNATPQYAYDWEHRLTNAVVGGVTISIGYDGDGNRVSKTVAGVTTRYLVDDRNLTGYAQVIEELNTGGAFRVYAYGLDLISQDQLGSSNWVASFYAYDGQGSVRLLTDGNGAVTDTYSFDPYGNLTYVTGQTPNLYLYTGEQIDPDLGMYYLRARYYQPGIGRFWTADSYEGQQSEPLSLHKYLYCHGNPVNNTDPSGHESLGTINISMSLGASLQSFGASAAVGIKAAAANTIAQTVAAATMDVLALDALMQVTLRDAIAQAKDILRQAGRALRNLKVVPVSQAVMPDVARNVSLAQAAGQSMLLTRVSPGQAKLNRRDATRGLGSAGPGMSWDEYPFASGRVGGIPPRVVAVPWLQNAIQGGVIAASYKIENINVGDNFFVVVIP